MSAGFKRTTLFGAKLFCSVFRGSQQALYICSQLTAMARCYWAWIFMWFWGFCFFWVSFIKYNIVWSNCQVQCFCSCWKGFVLGWIVAWILCRSKGRWRGSGGGGTCRGTWALTPNISTRRSAAAATTSAPRSPCWRGAAPKRGGVRPPARTTCPAYESDGQRPRGWKIRI